MRIQVTLDSSAGALTIHAEGYSTATPPARLAATLASIVETALTEPAPAAQPSPAAQQPPVDPPPVDTARPAAPAADQRPMSVRTTCPTAEAPAARPVATKPVATKPVATKPVATKPVATKPVATKPVATKPVATKPVATKVAAEVAPDVQAGDSGQDASLRRTALKLLDDGLTDDQVCRQLGISRSRLLRWDDPNGEFLAPPTGTLAAVSA